jgi:hypothetical protein
MKVGILIVLFASVELVCCTRPKEEPEVAYRHCMEKNAHELGRPRYQQAIAFSRTCDGYAVEAAKLWTRDELGPRFDPKSTETMERIREKHQTIVEAYICAVSSDRPIPPCTPMM